MATVGAMTTLDPMSSSVGPQPDRGALLVSADPALVLEVERFAAAAGTTLQTTCDVPAAARAWAEAGAVLVGADLAADLVAHGVRRRDETYLLSLGTATDECFRWAVGLGAGAVLELPDAAEWLVDALTDQQGRVTATTLAVVGGAGGVGASNLAAALALRAGRSGPVTLVDLDPDGPGLQRLLGLDEAGVTWAELAASYGRLGGGALRASLPGSASLRVLGWPVDPTSGARPDLSALPVAETLATARRGCDWLVLDLPRVGLPQLAGTIPDLVDQLVVVVRPTVAGVAAAVRTLDRLEGVRAPVGLVVRARRGSPVTREVATALRAPVLAELPDHRRLDEHLDLGLGPVHDRRSPFGSAADSVLSRWSA